MGESTKTILVSGTGGFIGRKFVTLLHKLGKPYGVIEREMYDKVDQLEDVINDANCVVHLGGLIKGNSQELHSANIQNTIKILDIISRMENKPCFIFASSFSVYAIQEKILSEDSSVGPRNDYGKSKLEVEDLIKKYSEKFGITAVILRLANVYGPGMPPNSHSVVATFIDQGKRGSSFTINGNGEQQRDFVYIDDVCDALVKVIKYLKINNNGKSMVVNICSGVGISLNRLISDIGKLSRISPKITYHDYENVEKGFWVGDNTIALKVFGWKPEISFLEGLKKSYEES